MKKKPTVKTAFKVHGIFQAISTLHYHDFFMYFSPSTMDSLFLSKHGKKSISEFVEDNMIDNVVTETSIHNIATIIDNMYGSKWDRLFSVMESELKLLENYQDKVTETVNDDGETTSKMLMENSDGNVNKVSAFNDDDFVNKESDERTSTGKNDTTGTNKNKRIREVIKSGYVGNPTKEYQQAIDYLQKNIIYDTIFADVNSLVSIQIYD